jgi:uncharacterized protein (TIGR02118 family)
MPKLIMALRRPAGGSVADFGRRVRDRAAEQGAANGCVVDLVDRPPVEAAGLPTPDSPPLDALVELWVDDPAGAFATWRADPALGAGAGYVVDEAVQRDYPRTWSEGESSPGIKAVYLIRPTPGISVEEFVRHWRDVHGPLALRHHIGAWKYVQNAVEERFGDADPTIVGLAELHFPTVDDLVERMYDSEEGVQAIAADVAQFVGGADGYLATEYVLCSPQSSRPASAA